MEHTTPSDASPVRATGSLRCPVCPSSSLGAGPLHHCSSCKGTWVEEKTLATRVAAVRDEALPPITWPRLLEWERTTSAGRPCAQCRTPMPSMRLYEVPLDRCALHGVWFDRGELATVLERCKGRRTQVAAGTAPSSSGIDAGDVALAAVDVTDVATDGIDIVGGIADVGSAVVDGVLDVLGSIFSAIDL